MFGKSFEDSLESRAPISWPSNVTMPNGRGAGLPILSWVRESTPELFERIWSSPFARDLLTFALNDSGVKPLEGSEVSYGNEFSILTPTLPLVRGETKAEQEKRVLVFLHDGIHYLMGDLIPVHSKSAPTLSALRKEYGAVKDELTRNSIFNQDDLSKRLQDVFNTAARGLTPIPKEEFVRLCLLSEADASWGSEIKLRRELRLPMTGSPFGFSGVHKLLSRGVRTSGGTEKGIFRGIYLTRALPVGLSCESHDEEDAFNAIVERSNADQAYLERVYESRVELRSGALLSLLFHERAFLPDAFEKSLEGWEAELDRYNGRLTTEGELLFDWASAEVCPSEGRAFLSSRLRAMFRDTIERSGGYPASLDNDLKMGRVLSRARTFQRIKALRDATQGSIEELEDRVKGTAVEKEILYAYSEGFKGASDVFPSAITVSEAELDIPSLEELTPSKCVSLERFSGIFDRELYFNLSPNEVMDPRVRDILLSFSKPSEELTPEDAPDTVFVENGIPYVRTLVRSEQIRLGVSKAPPFADVGIGRVPYLVMDEALSLNAPPFAFGSEYERKLCAHLYNECGCHISPYSMNFSPKRLVPRFVPFSATGSQFLDLYREGVLERLAFTVFITHVRGPLEIDKEYLFPRHDSEAAESLNKALAQKGLTSLPEIYDFFGRLVRGQFRRSKGVDGFLHRWCRRNVGFPDNGLIQEEALGLMREPSREGYAKRLAIEWGYVKGGTFREYRKGLRETALGDLFKEQVPNSTKFSFKFFDRCFLAPYVINLGLAADSLDLGKRQSSPNVLERLSGEALQKALTARIEQARSIRTKLRELSTAVTDNRLTEEKLLFFRSLGGALCAVEEGLLFAGRLLHKDFKIVSAEPREPEEAAPGIFQGLFVPVPWELGDRRYRRYD